MPDTNHLKLSTGAVKALLEMLDPELVVELQQSVIANIARRIMPSYLEDLTREKIHDVIKTNRSDLIDVAAVQTAAENAFLQFVGREKTWSKDRFALSEDAKATINVAVREAFAPIVKEEVDNLKAGFVAAITEQMEAHRALMAEQAKKIVEEVSAHAVAEQVEHRIRAIMAGLNASSPAPEGITQ